MIRKLIDRQIEQLLPLYTNGRISPIGRRLVEAWLQVSSDAADKAVSFAVLHETVQREPGMQPPTRWPVLPGASVQTAPASAAAWRLGLGLVLLLLTFSWVVLPPAVELEWSVEGSAPAAFRVYRSSEMEPTGFRLVEEIPAGAAGQAYQFRDLQLLPGQELVYRIEAVGQDGTAVADEIVTGDASLVLPGQLALLLTVAITLYGAATYRRQSTLISFGMMLPGA